MNDLYPLLFEPILMQKVWGGRRLDRLGKRLPATDPIGESWELADLPEGRSVVRNGPLAGRTLHDLLRTDATSIVGALPLTGEGGFPLLVKYLDARENLSIQVHPSADYAAAHPEAHLKSEAWFVVDAEPGSVIYRGLRPGLSPERLRDDLKRGRLAEDLLAFPAVAGDCHYLPSGTCHALGAGVLVAEVQTTSDTTFRLDDWGRKGRAMHVDQAIECIDFGEATPSAPPAPPAPFRLGPITTRPLVTTEHFGLELIEVSAAADVPVVTNGLPEVWMQLAGTARIPITGGRTVDVEHGDTVLIPAGLPDGRAIVTELAQTLRVTLPSPLAGLIA